MDKEFREKTSPVWDMSQERALLEQLVSQRGHVYLFFVSIVLAAALNAKVQAHLQIILTVGTVVSWIIQLGVIRISERLDQALRELASDPSHPLTIVNEKLQRTERGHGVYRVLLQIPYLTLAAATLLAYFDVFRVPVSS